MVLGIEDLDFSRDRSLVQRMRLGDEDAFAELYRRHHDRIFRYCLYRLGEAHEAQDVVQEAFTRAWVKAPRIQGDLHFYPWLRTIAGNLCTDVGRRRARVQPASELDPGSTDGDQERIIQMMDAALVKQAIARLPERHRQILEMREHEGLSYEQLADRTGTSVGTVESLLWRARQGLKRQFAVVSGESVLAGLPLLGWALRRAHAVHARFVARLAGNDPGNLAAIGGAVGGVAITSVFAAVLVVGGMTGSTSGNPPAAVQTASPAVSTAQSLMQLAAQPLSVPPTVPPGTAVQVVAPPAPHAGSHSGPQRTELTNPVQTNPAQARAEAQQDPVQASIGQVSAGIDPPAVVAYLAQLPPAHPAVP